MNYFELYPGDYLRDTSRLSLVDHGAYLRLMIAYYGEEQPLPADHAELYTIVAAVNAGDKAAVRKVADRYFPVGDDGLRRNGRADEEIAKAQKRIQTARENGAKNKPKAAQPDTQPDTQRVGQRDTQRQTHSGEALHTPHATPLHEGSVAPPPAAAVALEGVFEGHEAPRETPNPAAAYAIALTRAGFQVTSMNPDLIAYVDAGGTIEHLQQVASLSDCAGKKAGYVLAIARRELAAQAAPITGGSHANRPQGRESLVDHAAARAQRILGDAAE